MITRSRHEARVGRAPEGVHQPVERQSRRGPGPGLHGHRPTHQVDLRDPAADDAHPRTTEEPRQRPPLYGRIPGRDLVQAGPLHPLGRGVDDRHLDSAAPASAGGAPRGEEPRIAAAHDHDSLGAITRVAPPAVPFPGARSARSRLLTAHADLRGCHRPGFRSIRFRPLVRLSGHGCLLWWDLHRWLWFRLDRSASTVGGDGGAGDVARPRGCEEGDDLGDLLGL